MVQRLAAVGRVSLGLRHWYLGGLDEDTQASLLQWDEATADGNARLDAFCCHQPMLGELLLEHELIAPTLFGQAMIDFDPEQSRLGDFLIARKMIDDTTLARALALQQQHRRAAMAAVVEAPA